MSGILDTRIPAYCNSEKGEVHEWKMGGANFFIEGTGLDGGKAPPHVGQPYWYTIHMIPYLHMTILICVHSGLVHIQSVPFGTL